MAMTRGELGARRPIHVGTRILTSEQHSPLVAFPVLRGETVERIALDVSGLTTDDNTNFDQPPIFSWAGIAVPFNTQTGGISTSDIAGQFTDVFGIASQHLGGEPNPGGNVQRGDLSMARVWFRRHVIGDPVPVGKDALDNADARFVDRFRTVVKKGWKADFDQMCIFGHSLYNVDAQTDFGIAEIDVSIGSRRLNEAYTQRGETITDAGALKAHELLYDGDNYIEADSFKATHRRTYAIIRPTIRRSERLLTSY